MPTYREHVQKLLKRSAKFRKRIEKAFEKHAADVDLSALNDLLKKVDQEIVRLGRMRARKKR